MPPSLAEQIGVEQLAPGRFVSTALPIRVGNSLPIAYGGCAAAVAVHAACLTLPAGSSLSLYSVVGHFLGPASIDRKLYCAVTETRNTRTFATRRVQVSQRLDGGEERVCMELVADFHADEPSSLEYSAPPSVAYPKPLDCLTLGDRVRQLHDQGLATQAQTDVFTETFAPLGRLFETRYCPNGVSAQNLAGVLKAQPTTQDALLITSKTSAEWQRAAADADPSSSKPPLSSRNEHLAALAFLMDGALSFLPLSHNRMWFDDVAACSTLDFALRVFVPDVDLHGWLLRERVTSRAGAGRSYSEGRLWDERGNLVASNTQQSILRAKKGVPTLNL